jgi:CrcB protein
MDELPVDPDLVDVRGRPRLESKVLAAISIGAMGGATARYELAAHIHVPAGGFPWPTFWANISGSFLLGVVLAVLLERFPPSRYARAFAATGFLGAYTTFSTFSVETDLLIKDGYAGTALLYVGASLGVGLAIALLGLLVGRRATPAPSPRSDGA